MKKLLSITLAIASLYLLPSHLQAQGLKVTSGGYLMNHLGYIGCTGNIINNGTLTDTTGTLLFSGTTQSLSGSNGSVLNNLVVSNGSTTTIASPGHTLKGVLTSNGTLSAQGNLTLTSTAAQTALVSGAGTGSVTGNLVMQRYLSSGFGYKYFSSPFQAATVNEFSGLVDLGAAFPTFYSYYENSDTTWWINYTSGSNILFPMLGYAVNFGSSHDPKTVTLTGVVSNGNLSLTLYNHERTHTKGFNLVGNPYPSPIDWDAATGWTRTNIDNAIYYFNSGSADQYVGSYSTYINGISSDGIANNLIPAMQGFFVHVSNGSFPVTGVLSFSNAIRINTPNPVFHKSGPKEEDFLIRISAGFEDAIGLADPLVVMFDAEAKPEFNHWQDAVKLMNTNGDIPNFYSIANDNIRYAIKALPFPEDSLTVIPLGITTLKPGIVDFKVMTMEPSIPWQNIYFSDNRNMAVTRLQTGSGYNVFLDEGEYDNRFSLIFSLKEIQTSSGSGKDLVAYYHDGKIFVYLDFLNGETGTLQVTDMVGKILRREKVTGVVGYHSMEVNVSSGLYIVSLTSEHMAASKKLMVY